MSGLVARVYLLAEAGRPSEAEAALAALEAAAPDGPEAALARLHLGLPPSGSVVSAPPLASSKTDGASAEAFTLLAPHPNPADGRVAFPLSLGAVARVRLAVYDVLGREVGVVADGTFEPGEYAPSLDASALAPGAYVARAVVTGGGGLVRVLSARLTVAR